MSHEMLPTDQAAEDRLDRAHGAMLGQLIGDSLGSRVESRTAGWIAANYPDGVQELADGGPHRLAAGQPTDDSEMALALLRSLTRHEGFDREDVLETYRRWATSQPFDIGDTCRRALIDGIPNPDSQANGALMRVSPLVVLAAAGANPQIAAVDAAMTHPNPVCQEVNVLFTRVGALLINGLPVETALKVLADRATGVVADWVADGLRGPPSEFMDQMGWVRIAFTNAVHELAHGTSFAESLVRTIGRGGDTDTNAAICGTLLGARYGRSAIPADWARTVLNCRPREGSPRPRPPEYWPSGALQLVDEIMLG